MLVKEEVPYLSRICSSPTSGLLQTALRSSGLLLHHRDKLLEREQRLVQSLDRYPFDGLLLMPDDQLLGSSVDTEIHVVAYQSLLDIIGNVIQEHGAIVTDFTNEVPTMHVAEPGIGIYQAWNRWQSRQGGKRDTRRAIAAGERLIGSFVIVMLHKGLRPLPEPLPAYGDASRANIPA